jgi:hypothetical protein
VRSLDPLGGEIRRELVRLGPGGAIADVVAVWPAAVGPAIAANAWPARIARDGTLHVSTSSSAWAFELTHLEDTVRARLGEHLGEGAPPRLRFATGRLPEPGVEDETEVRRTVTSPSPAARAAGEHIAAGITDPNLREAVSRAAAASLAATEGRPSDRPVW